MKNTIKDMKNYIILILIGIFSYWGLNNLDLLWSIIKTIYKVLEPFILGGIIAFILNKINYFNRIFLSFTDTEKNVFIEWIKQYNLKIENYINNDNSIQICEELYNNYQY